MVRNLFPVEAPAAPLSEVMDVAEVARILDIHPDTVRRGIREDMVDGGRRIPGGRHIGSRYFVIRAVFERAVRDGVEPERVERVEPAVDLEAARRCLAELAAALAG